jgi:hypothetical protein
MKMNLFKDRKVLKEVVSTTFFNQIDAKKVLFHKRYEIFVIFYEIIKGITVKSDLQ